MYSSRFRTIGVLIALAALVLGGATTATGAEEAGDVSSALLLAEDLPADLVSQTGVLDEPAFDYDQASYDANGGVDKANQVWQVAEVVPGIPIVVVFDFRFLFPSAEAAQAYLDAAEPILSESATGITLQPDSEPLGDDLRHYAGSLSQGDLTIDVHNFLSRTGPVVSKVYVTGFGTTLEDARPIAEAAHARIDSWLAAQPTGPAAASAAPAAASSAPTTTTGPQASAAAQADPVTVDTAVPYVDSDGVARGTVTVRQVADPFTEHRPDSPPDEGTRYVMLTIAFESAEDQPFDADPSDILVQDSDGFLWGRASINRPPEATIPELSSQEMGPGNRVSGVIGYVVPADATIERILYQPEGGRLMTLAQLTQADPVTVDTAVPYVDSDGVARGTVTVRQVADPFTEHRPDSPPDEGTRYVMLTIAFESAEDQPFDADPSDILVQDSDGFLWGRASINRPPEATIPELSSQEMGPGNRVSGVIGYVVPADATIERILYQPEGGRLMTLAQLAAGDGA